MKRVNDIRVYGKRESMPNSEVYCVVGSLTIFQGQ